MSEQQQLRNLIEAALFVADRPLSIDDLQATVLAPLEISRTRVRQTLQDLMLEYEERGIRLIEVASGYRFQADDSLSQNLSLLWQEKAPKYSRAFLETLSLIAYRQPITRGEIEDVRGVSVSSNIMRSMLERGWIKIVGHKEVPGRPALYATTKTFLDYFSLKSVADLPPLEQINITDLQDSDLQAVEIHDNAASDAEDE